MQFTIVPVTPFLQNCSILVCERTRKAAVVDPGGDLNLVLSAVRELGVTIEKILITHGHLDHAGGAAELRQNLVVPIEGPNPEDQFWIDGIPQQSATFGLPGARSFVPDRWLHEGDTVQFGEQTLMVHHCPGHTPGHVVFYHPSAKIAFVGDVLFRGSIGRTDFPRGDFDTLIHSIRERLWPLGDDVTFVPGHGPLSTIGEERRTNPFAHD